MSIMYFGKILGRIVVIFGTLMTIFGIYGLFNPQGGSDAIMFAITLGGVVKDVSVLPMIFVGLLVVSLLCVFVPMMKGFKKMDHLFKVGENATVKILDVQDTKYTEIKKYTYAKITVEATNGQRANCLFYVPKTDIPKRGEEIDILYDPADPTVIMVTQTRHASESPS